MTTFVTYLSLVATRETKNQICQIDKYADISLTLINLQQTFQRRKDLTFFKKVTLKISYLFCIRFQISYADIKINLCSQLKNGESFSSFGRKNARSF